MPAARVISTMPAPWKPSRPKVSSAALRMRRRVRLPRIVLGRTALMPPAPRCPSIKFEYRFGFHLKHRSRPRNVKPEPLRSKQRELALDLLGRLQARAGHAEQAYRAGGRLGAGQQGFQQLHEVGQLGDGMERGMAAGDELEIVVADLERPRSEERRVGKEGRSRRWAWQE